MFDLSGKVVFVAGGAGYLGAPVCRGLLGRGAAVAVADANGQRLEALINETETTVRDKLLTLEFDVTKEDSIDAAITKTMERFGRLDGLVNATFASSTARFEDLTAEEFDRTNRCNITGTFLLARRASREMSHGGSIVLYSSMYGVIAPDPRVYPDDIAPNPIDYGAGKAAVIQMTKYMAAHFAKRRIRVNAVAPGAFPWVPDHAERSDFLDKLSQKAMLERIGKRDETAGAVVFLMTDDASFITGQTVGIDGGVTAW